MKTFQDLLQESQQLNEAYDNLGALKADKSMLKIFRRKVGGILVGYVGEKSKVVTVTQNISTWKDIRKIAKNDESVSGVALYANDELFLLIAATGDSLASINNDVSLVSIVNKSFTDKVKQEIKSGSKFLSMANSGKITTHMVKELTMFVDDVIPALENNNIKVTAKIVTSDMESVQKFKDRNKDKWSPSADKLADRSKNGIARDLENYKASKAQNLSGKSAKDVFLWALQNPNKPCLYNDLALESNFDAYNLMDLLKSHKVTISLKPNRKSDNHSALRIKLTLDIKTGDISYDFDK